MSNSSSGVKKLFGWIRKVLEVVCGILMIALTIVVLAQVVNRFVFHGSFAWAEEAAIYMMVWLIFLGASINILKDSNIRIDFFIRLLPERVQHGLDAVCQVVCAVFVGLLCEKSWSIVAMNSNNLAPGLRIPIATLYMGLTFSAVLMVIFFIYRMVEEIRLACGKGGNEA